MSKFVIGDLVELKQDVVLYATKKENDRVIPAKLSGTVIEVRSFIIANSNEIGVAYTIDTVDSTIGRIIINEPLLNKFEPPKKYTTNRKAPISLEIFKKTIDALKETDDKNTEFSKNMEKISGCYFISELNYPLNSSIVDLLESIFNDIDDGWISYWLYDLEYGTNKELRDTVKEEDGTLIPIETIEDLYTLLVDNFSKK